MAQTCTAYGIGGADDGFGDNWDPSTYTSEGTNYQVMSGGQEFKVTCEPTSSTDDLGYGESCYVDYGVSVTPVQINFLGTVPVLSGGNLVLAGQQISATLDAGDYSVVADSYSWSTVASDAFKYYDNQANHNQKSELSAGDYLVSNFLFYTASAEEADVSCSAIVIFPDGTYGGVSVTKALTSLAAQASIAVGGRGFDNSPNGYGMYEAWRTNIFVPFPFSGGLGSFTQIVTASSSLTRTLQAPADPPANPAPVRTYYLKMSNGAGGYMLLPTGLDGVFSQDTVSKFDENWAPINDGNGGHIAGGLFPAGINVQAYDTPTASESTLDLDMGGTAWNSGDANESFVTTLMFLPTTGYNTVFVPIDSVKWSWKGSASNATGLWVASSITAIKGAASATSTFPTWDYVVTIRNYRP